MDETEKTDTLPTSSPMYNFVLAGSQCRYVTMASPKSDDDLKVSAFDLDSSLRSRIWILLPL